MHYSITSKSWRQCAAQVRLEKGSAQLFRLANFARIFINLSWYDIIHYTVISSMQFIWMPSLFSVSYELYLDVPYVKQADGINLSTTEAFWGWNYFLNWARVRQKGKFYDWLTILHLYHITA